MRTSDTLTVPPPTLCEMVGWISLCLCLVCCIVSDTKVRIGGYLWLGHSSEELTADMRSCRQNHPGPNVLAGSGHACLGVSVEFMADDLEVLHVAAGQ